MTSPWSYVWNDAEDRLRVPWRFVMGALLFLFLSIVVAVVTSPLPAPDTIAQPALASTYGTVRVLVLVGLFVVILVGTSWVVDRREWRDLGLQFDRAWWRDAAVGLALGLAATAVVVGLALAAGLAALEGVLATRDVASLAPIAAGTPALLGAVLVAATFLGVAVFEEVLVRGYLMTNLAEGFVGWFGRRGAVAAAAAVTAAAFGALHVANPDATAVGVVAITGAGVVLAVTYALTGRLGLAIGFHLGWNVGLGAVFGAPVSGFPTPASLVSVSFTGPVLVTGGAFGPEGGLLGLLGFVLAGAGAVWWIRRAYGPGVAASVTRPALRTGSRSEGESSREE
ncbi:MAG: lysostaphin resistance A-like protein [Haloarculaceae archaeon]